MTRTNMRSELKNSRDLRIEGRQSIHFKNMSKAGLAAGKGAMAPSENGDHVVGRVGVGVADSNLTLAHDGNMKFSKQSDCHRTSGRSESRKVSLDGTDTPRCAVESLDAISDTPETKHLKDLLLLHLDWIQQQQEMILTKDRQIQALRSDKDALKCRLERMERRMSLLRHKGGDLSDSQLSLTEDSPRGASPGTIGRENYNRGMKRKSSFEPQNLNKRFAATTRAERQKEREQQERDRTRETLRPCSRRSPMSPEKAESVCSNGHHRLSHDTDIEVTDDDTHREEGTTHQKVRNFARRKWRIDVNADYVTKRQPFHLKPVVFKRTRGGREDDLLRTECLYYVNVDKYVQSDTVSPPQTQRKPALTVPSWRVNHIPTGYQLEGTENLDDEIFLKRHQKPEQEEKRRKRWDLQRLREQRLYDKLQQGRSAEAQLQRGEDQNDVFSFLPEAENAKFIEVSDKIPVTAFGYPIPNFKPAEFELPWYDLEKREERRPCGRPRKNR